MPEGYIADQVRLFQVSYPLLRAATPWCKDRATHGMGLYALNRHTMGIYGSGAWRYGIGDQMRVLAAIPDGPAHRGGIEVGDIIVDINGEPAPTTAAATRVFGLKMSQFARSGTPVQLTVLRGEQTITATVKPEPICGYQVQVAEVRQVNARADGRRSIHITRGMLRFVRSDAELALVVAHEIAHNAMGHLEARTQLVRSLAAAGNGTKTDAVNPEFSQALEMEADHMGLYIVARAGMPIDAAPGFIARLGAASSGNLQTRTHPASNARVAALKRTIDDIERKRTAGADLVP